MKKGKILERRSYRLRCLRNWALAALVLFLMWMGAGYPLPRPMEFQRMERQRLLHPSQILLEVEGGRSGDDDLALGVTEDHVHTFNLDLNRLIVWERQGDRPTLVPLPGETRYREGWNSYLASSLAAVDAPAEAAAATVTIELTYNGVINDRPVDWAETYVLEGEQRGDCWFFQFIRHHAGEGSLEEEAEDYWLASLTSRLTYYPTEDLPSYTLEFFDSEGESLGRYEDTFRLVGWRE